MRFAGPAEPGRLAALGAGDTIRRPLRRPAGHTHRCGWRCAGINRTTTARLLARRWVAVQLAALCFIKARCIAPPHEDESSHKSVAVSRPRRTRTRRRAKCCSSERRDAQATSSREGASAASASISQRNTRCDYLPAGDTDKAVWVIPLRKSTSGIQSLASPRGVRGFHTRYIYAGRCRR